jgi:hypothetical protein
MLTGLIPSVCSRPAICSGDHFGLQSVDDQVAQLWMSSELAQPSAALLAHVVGDCPEVTSVFWKLAVVERVALELAIYGLTMTAELAGDLTNRQLAFL